MNVVTLIGRITHDLELQDNGNTQWINYQLAVASRNPKKDDNFIKCVAFGKTAEVLNNWSGKGALIAIEGSLETEEYQADGKTVKTYRVITNRVEPIEWKRKKTAEEAKNPPQGGETRQTGNTAFDDINDDQIPF